ncbi:hypothetical protein MROS_2661 [Melioribacter roseus P3M-2]|uniref:Uncharacterized protein n=1 Tax=Melioribacter roseus (strain DSM 23840 / JCM 17771 / VKM B-2668 / P3M-2) TaxID=1191523 RepID=I7A7P8_MELRP|nr:hypothetical protein [Melioribacter roseus]AFN75891.1 hypothetical protein MROS_2661 [Melioribacter roseus P3M-2]
MLLYAIIGYFILFALFIILSFKYAPFGYEDKSGFHYIKKQNKKAA